MPEKEKRKAIPASLKEERENEGLFKVDAAISILYILAIASMLAIEMRQHKNLTMLNNLIIGLNEKRSVISSELQNSRDIAHAEHELVILMTAIIIGFGLFALFKTIIHWANYDDLRSQREVEEAFKSIDDPLFNEQFFAKNRSPEEETIEEQHQVASFALQDTASTDSSEDPPHSQAATRPSLALPHQGQELKS